MDNQTASEIMSAIQAVDDPKIIITTHHKPDADALGSSLGLQLFLQTFDLDVKVISPTDYAGFLKWMKGSDDILIYEHHKEVAAKLAKEADFIFCLDFNHLSRIDDFGIEVGNSKAKKILIDHHQFPQNFQDFTFWDDKASSTCELVYRFIQDLEQTIRIHVDMASCFYTGLVTDTGSFRFASTSSETLRIASKLMDCGINHVAIYDSVFDSFTEKRVKFIGYAISQKLEVLREYNTAIIVINSQELKDFEIITGDTEGLVNYGLSIEGIKFAALIIDRNKIVKMSFRSKGEFAANQFAIAHFNGGGHFHAAGGASELSLEETVNKFKEHLKLYHEQLNDE
jgi:bifunctional oligoribonuclease and PAP phosphatase NrnA